MTMQLTKTYRAVTANSLQLLLRTSFLSVGPCRLAQQHGNIGSPTNLAVNGGGSYHQMVLVQRPAVLIDTRLSTFGINTADSQSATDFNAVIN